MLVNERGYCTYCSAPKNDASGDLPAMERYLSDRIRHAVMLARDEGCPMWIVSGRYGLLEPTARIPWYDVLLHEDGVESLLPRCTQTLAASGIARLVYHTACPSLAPAVAPYLRLVRMACEGAGVELDVVTLPGVPV